MSEYKRSVTIGRAMAAGVGLSALLVMGNAQAMGDKELAAQVAKSTGLTAEQVQSVNQATEAAIVASLRAGEDVRLRNFGRFYAEERAAHTARNPATGEPVEVPDRSYLRFKAFDSGHERLR